jgi:mannose-1-phosphate guanylyltransferase
MRAIVLVGGYGTRLRPLTDSIPKSMLPVVHVPLIARLIGGLERGGVDAVTLALGFRAEPFVEAFPGGRCGGVAIDYAVEPEPLDTAGAIRFAADHARPHETFVVANGDVLTDLDVGALVAAHRTSGAAATIHLTAVDDPSAFGVADLDAAGRVRAFVEKPAPGTEPSNLINAGTYVFEPDVLDLIEPGGPVSVERDTFPRLVAAARMYAVATDDYWIDAGRPELYLRANLDLVTGRRRERAEPVHATAELAEGVTLDAAVVGAATRVGAGSTVTRSVLLPGAMVGAGAVVDDSIVMGTVGDRARVVRAVLGAGAIIPDGESVVDTRVPEPVG